VKAPGTTKFIALNVKLTEPKKQYYVVIELVVVIYSSQGDEMARKVWRVFVNVEVDAIT
jgi:hypothetical protein